MQYPPFFSLQNKWFKYSNVVEQVACLKKNKVTLIQHTLHCNLYLAELLTVSLNFRKH